MLNKYNLLKKKLTIQRLSQFIEDFSLFIKRSFIKEQKASGLGSNLGRKTPLSNIPLAGLPMF